MNMECFICKRNGMWSRSGYWYFNGWYYDGTEYTRNTVFKGDSDITLTASWYYDEPEPEPEPEPDYPCVITGNPACRSCASTSCRDILGSYSMTGDGVSIGSRSGSWTGKKIWGDILGIVENITGFLKDMAKIRLDWLENLDLSPLLKSVEKLLGAFRRLSKACGEQLKSAYKNVLLPLAKWTIEKAVPGLVDMLGEALDFIGDVVNEISPSTLNLLVRRKQPQYRLKLLYRS